MLDKVLPWLRDESLIVSTRFWALSSGCSLCSPSSTTFGHLTFCGVGWGLSWSLLVGWVGWMLFLLAVLRGVGLVLSSRSLVCWAWRLMMCVGVVPGRPFGVVRVSWLRLV